MPQENIMANARLGNKKKTLGPKIFFVVVFIFVSFHFSCFKSRAILYTFCFSSVVLQGRYKITNFDDFSYLFLRKRLNLLSDFSFK